MNRNSQKKRNKRPMDMKNVGNEAEIGRERKYKLWKKYS